MRETELDLDLLAQTESVFALANGHIGLRGNLDEGEPNGLPGHVPQLALRAAAAAATRRRGYGYPGVGPDDRQRHGRQDHSPARRRRAVRRPLRQLAAHERVLDMRAGVLRRAEWTSPAGGTVRVRSTRLVSLAQRAVGAILYEVEPHRRLGSRDRAVGAGRERAGLVDADVRSARRGGARGAPQVRGPLRTRRRRRPSALDEAQRAPDGRRDGSHRRWARRNGRHRREQPGRRPPHGRGRPRERRRASAS